MRLGCEALSHLILKLTYGKNTKDFVDYFLHHMLYFSLVNNGVYQQAAPGSLLMDAFFALGIGRRT